MKVALIHNFLYPESGATELVLNTATQLKKRGHKVRVFVLNAPNEVLSEFRRIGVKVDSSGFREWRTNDKRFFSFADPLMLFLNKLRVLPKLFTVSLAVNKDFDLAFTSHYHLTTLTHLFLKVPVVYYCHEPPRFYYEDFNEGGSLREKIFFPKYLINWLYKSFDRKLDKIQARKSDVIIVNSDYSKNVVKKVYGRDSKRIYSGVDTEIFKRLDVEREIILSVGRLYHDLKGHRFVIKSLGRLRSDKPPLVILGGGSEGERNDLVKLAAENNVRLDIKECVSRKELIDYYNRARVCVFGYVREPFGLTAIEAMACETPVVAVSEGGLCESITGDVGFLVERDEKEFAGKLKYILDNPAIAVKMGAAGRKRVKQFFTWDVFGGKLDETLNLTLN
ncbi:MAG: glycosyltransferase family 4 protein [Methanobacteriota archaeon]